MEVYAMVVKEPKVWLTLSRLLEPPPRHPCTPASVQTTPLPPPPFPETSLPSTHPSTLRKCKVSARLLPAARTNDPVMECLPPCAEGESRTCALSQCRDMCCTHRIQLAYSDQWYFISEHCRNRIAAACDFYTYIGHIAKGFIKLEAKQLFWQVSRLRAMMNLARLNLDLPD